MGHGRSSTTAPVLPTRPLREKKGRESTVSLIRPATSVKYLAVVVVGTARVSASASSSC
jgi:hypothetical protein